VPRLIDRVYLIDDGRSGYHTCGPTPPPAVIDRHYFFVKTPPALDAALRVVNVATDQVLSTLSRWITVPKVATLIASSKRRTVMGKSKSRFDLNRK